MGKQALSDAKIQQPFFDHLSLGCFYFSFSWFRSLSTKGYQNIWTEDNKELKVNTSPWTKREEKIPWEGEFTLRSDP